MKTLIAGGKGLPDRELLANAPDAVVLSRDPTQATPVRHVFDYAEPFGALGFVAHRRFVRRSEQSRP